MRASAVAGAVAAPIRPIIFAAGRFRNGDNGLHQQGCRRRDVSALSTSSLTEASNVLEPFIFPHFPDVKPLRTFAENALARGRNQSGKVRFAPLKNSISAA
ncbi:hypothetical protein [Agrobacterium tumefaciens]|uniref:hypothetical protein n=1 Tax=Agrobacterium tumefaciens TaxID=358 RepID=UPI00157272CF|nr:hypothetical protein [Agrobacterium tumefaciens]NSX93333.1 hypothetical protein [Agrobacterium tumefaciens]